jgi:hypothetical protein
MNGLREWVAGMQRDSAAQAQFIKTVFYLYPAALIMLGFFAFFLWDQEFISKGVFQLLLVLNIPVALVLVLVVWQLVGGFSEGVAQILLGSGNLKPDPGFSIEEGMIARGEFQQARETLESRLTGGPDDVAVQLRLAQLSSRQLRDPPQAERWYLAARQAGGSDRQRATVGNGLIDLYRASGQSGRLMVELARFAEAWPGTRAAEDARRELQDLKRELR